MKDKLLRKGHDGNRKQFYYLTKIINLETAKHFRGSTTLEEGVFYEIIEPDITD